LAAASSAEIPPPRSAVEPDSNDHPPSSGVGMIITGWIMSGVGVMNLALIPVCTMDAYPRQSRDLCVQLSIGVGVIGLGVGIPLLAVGYHKRSQFKTWKQRHAVLNELLSTEVMLQNESALLVYRGTF
jgi:hypothetical protein